jgi:hypothetical protein
VSQHEIKSLLDLYPHFHTNGMRIHLNCLATRGLTVATVLGALPIIGVGFTFGFLGKRAFAPSMYISGAVAAGKVALAAGDASYLTNI